MPSKNNALIDHSRLSYLEDSDTDFPYYNGQPTTISSIQWLFILLMVVLGFLAVALALPGLEGSFLQFIPAWLIVILPLGALTLVTPKYWSAIFIRVSWRDLKLMFGFAFLNIIVTLVIGMMLNSLMTVNPNGINAQLVSMDIPERILFFLKTLPQLLGEELITILPFLALMYFLSAKIGLSRQSAVIAAWLLSSVLFGLAHLPTYGWNWIQCIVIIGSARLVLTLAWIKTKNIWVSTGAHIINDWALFGAMLLGTGLLNQV